LRKLLSVNGFWCQSMLFEYAGVRMTSKCNGPVEPKLEKHFHNDSYSYRPSRSAHEALYVARSRCWKYDWVLDLDIKGFFDNIDWTQMIKAVRHHTDCKWVLLYIERWLRHP
jgi:RNA-directed DNA polymerase